MKCRVLPLGKINSPVDCLARGSRVRKLKEKNMKQKFYRCAHCGQIIAMVKETPVPIMCCGEPMKEIIPGTTDASHEKHIPEYKTENNIVKVTVCSVEHPMSSEHYIEWISIQTNKGNQRKLLSPAMKPYVEFLILPDEKIEAVFAYCNLHGLWKAE